MTIFAIVITVLAALFSVVSIIANLLIGISTMDRGGWYFLAGSWAVTGAAWSCALYPY